MVNPDPDLHVGPVDPTGPEALALIDALDRLQQDLYPEESNHLEPAGDLTRPEYRFLGVYADQTLVGCGAVRTVDGAYGELKRFYVSPAHRRRGIAQMLLTALEAHVLALGIDTVRLETGVYQHEALSFYAANGYRRVAPFGPYRTDPLSVFMEKHLGAA